MRILRWKHKDSITYWRSHCLLARTFVLTFEFTLVKTGCVWLEFHHAIQSTPYVTLVQVEKEMEEASLPMSLGRGSDPESESRMCLSLASLPTSWD
ncbi:Transmembrane And Coiled-Coil Domains Protein 2 [Manis pentadactyla]|nr:Transmembrane And Coiled-Coil Domains Protein 2 [Manis pentadactyla]